ncbi:MAG TPA: efflux RND transporter periplasmic adaptor subunit [Terriglobales bacterium]|nr:efflux RND transporter periplasmic adaptor subunit [Terriglobales bacterium]
MSRTSAGLSWSRAAAVTTLAALVIVAGSLVGCSNTKAAAPAVAAPVPVLAAMVEQKDMPVQLQAIGAVEAYSMVAVKTQVTGELTEVHFREGQEVKKGDLLFTLDKRPFEAELKKQQANLEHDIAQAKLAHLDAQRYEALYKGGVVSKQQYDQAQANAEALDAAVQADHAAVENAKVQLVYCSIYSPINGKTGNLMIHQGNMIKANDTPFLIDINQVQPIYVTFTVPEQYLADIKRFSTAGKLPVEAAIQGDNRPAIGKLSFIDNSVDQATGTIKLKGEFANTDRRLWPGQFVNVTLVLHTQPNAIVVPSQAVQNGQMGQFVFVIKPDMTVETRPVSVNRSSSGVSIIETGLKPGERVVTDGQLRLVPGARVQIKEAIAPGANPPANATPAAQLRQKGCCSLQLDGARS